MGCSETLCSWPSDLMDREVFIAKVWEASKPVYRNLPWREIDDAYGVLVSEVMLQQTQVKRVLGRWERFMHMFPTPDALAAADTAELLEEWQGMGYNRRALMLKRACEICSRDFEGKIPRNYLDLIALPGVGPSSAAGVIAFAYNEPAVYLETNVRTVFIHELFPYEDKVSDAQIRPLVQETCPNQNPRAWYYALLDYGAYLKSSLGKTGDAARRSASYHRQSTFEGSHRQKRAEVLRYVLDEPGITGENIEQRLDAFEESRGRQMVKPELVQGILNELVKEGFIYCSNGCYSA